MNFSKTFLAGLLAFIVGNILIAVLWSLFVMGIVGALSATTGIDDNSILRIVPFGDIVEAPPADPFAGVDFRTMTATPHVTLFEALRAIDAAKSDPRIKGIYIRPNGQGTVSMAVLEELRAAILDFKQESGKFVLAYNEAYGQGGYYLATAADGVYLQPEGLLDWHGMAVNTLFSRGCSTSSISKSRYSVLRPASTRAPWNPTSSRSCPMPIGNSWGSWCTRCGASLRATWPNRAA